MFSENYIISGNINYNIEYFPRESYISVIITDYSGPTKPHWVGFRHENKPYKIFDQVRENKAELIFNPYLLRAFQLKQAQTGLPSVDVFHGTIAENINSIAENNFNWRLSGRSRGWKHGKGVCFSLYESFVHQFCRGAKKRVIRTRILYRTACIGTQGQILPQNGFDSTRSPNGNVLVKFEDNEFLPLYVTHYDDNMPDIADLLARFNQIHF